MAMTAKQIAAALFAKGGNVSAAAKALGVTRWALHKRITGNQELKQMLIDAREEMVDIAESAAKAQIAEGNTAIIIFTLKTLGKERGYVERNEITGKEGGPLVFKVIYGTDDTPA